MIKVEDKATELDKRVTTIEIESRLKEAAYLDFKDKVEKFMDAAYTLFVTAIEFKPVRVVVYGIIGAVGLAFLTGLLGLILK